MIYFLLDKNNSFTIRNYQKYRGHDIAHKIGIVLYPDLEKLNGLEATTLIFSDLDRLNSKQLERVKQIANQIKQKHPDLKLINSPEGVMLRYDLLKTLFKNGINSFNVYRLNEPRKEIQFPVFLREENNHTGALTGLIYSEKQLGKHIIAKVLLGYLRKKLLIVEYCNISNVKGLSNKYSAVNLNGKIVPRYFEISKNWMVKSDDATADFPVEFKIEKYWEFLNSNPHEKWLQNIFKLSGINYGRIDYSIKDENKKQLNEVWEINLNPAYYGNPKRMYGEMDKIYQFSHNLMKEEYLKLDSGVSTIINIEIPKGTGKMLKQIFFMEAIRIFHNNFNTKLKFFKGMVKILIGVSNLLASFIVLCSISSHSSKTKS